MLEGTSLFNMNGTWTGESKEGNLERYSRVKWGLRKISLSLLPIGYGKFPGTSKRHFQKPWRFSFRDLIMNCFRRKYVFLVNVFIWQGSFGR